MKIKKVIKIFIILFFILLFFSVIFALINSANDKILSKVFIEKIEVSNNSLEEATTKINDLINKIKNKEIKLIYNDYQTSLILNELEPEYNVNDAITKAYNIGRGGNIFINNYNILFTKIFSKNINIDKNYNKEKLVEKINEINSSLPDALQESKYYIEDNNLIITKGKAGNIVDEEKFLNLIEEQLFNLNLEKDTIEIPVINKEPQNIDIEKIHDEIYKEAQDAYITQNPTVVHSEVNGVDFAISNEEIQKILQEDKEEYIIPLNITLPSKTVNDLGEDAFPDVLGTYTTLYDASNENRDNNVNLASEKINGTIIYPGETFSYNQIVGKRTIEAGYKEAGAYAGGKVVQEIGGGICQVSSTLYNAVLYANLEVVERYNHYFETSYVDPGRDATVSWGSLDFQFKNNRDYAIKIEAKARNGVCEITIKGIKQDNDYEVVIQPQVTSIIKKTERYENDSSLEEGVTQVTQEGHDGCTSETHKILKQNGAIISDEIISQDYYHALEKIIKKGTK